jgi:hypothetical protein
MMGRGSSAGPSWPIAQFPAPLRGAAMPGGAVAPPGARVREAGALLSVLVRFRRAVQPSQPGRTNPDS